MRTKVSQKKSNRPALLRRMTKTERTSAPGHVIDVVPVLLHLKTILVPYDFSSYSSKALNYALQFAEQFNAEVVVLYVVEPLPILPTDVIAAPPDTTGDRIPAISSRMEALCREAGTPHRLSVRALVITGTPYERIVETAKSQDADLIIIATHGYRGFKRFYMGSTTERVIRHAPCPVLVVRDKERDFVGPNT
jgi:universal stress protein A